MGDVHEQDVLAVTDAWRTLSCAWKEFSTDVAVYEKRQLESLLSLSVKDPKLRPYESQTMQGVDDHDYQVYTIYCQAIPEI